MQPDKLTFGLEEYCLALLLRHPSELSNLERLGLQTDDFTQTENRQLLELVKGWTDFDQSAEAPDLRESLAEVLFARYDTLVAHGQAYEPIVKDELERAALRLRERALRQQVERLRFMEDEARRMNEMDEMQDYRQRIALATEQLNWTQAAIFSRTTAGRSQREPSVTNEKTI